jgi:hypothetical protein
MGHAAGTKTPAYQARIHLIHGRAPQDERWFDHAHTLCIAAAALDFRGPAEMALTRIPHSRPASHANVLQPAHALLSPACVRTLRPLRILMYASTCNQIRGMQLSQVAPCIRLELGLCAGHAAAVAGHDCLSCSILQMYECVYVCMHACMYLFMHVCMYGVYVCMYVCMVCMYVCIYVFVHVHGYMCLFFEHTF